MDNSVKSLVHYSIKEFVPLQFMEIKNAKFIKSSTKLRDCPNPDKHEYAFVGRSNVGKSSLINMLTNRKSLAKTSATPGKTQLINHFDIDEKWYLVDLPGYGWARTSKKNKKEWVEFIEAYLLKRENLICVFQLIDIRHEPQKIDLELMEWFVEKEIPFILVFTKADKLSTHQKTVAISKYFKILKRSWEEIPKYFITSSVGKDGKEELLEYIDTLNTTIDF